MGGRPEEGDGGFGKVGTSSEIGAGGRMGGGGGTGRGGEGAVRFWRRSSGSPGERAGRNRGSGFLDVEGRGSRKMGDAGERTGAETPRKEEPRSKA